MLSFSLCTHDIVLSNLRGLMTCRTMPHMVHNVEMQPGVSSIDNHIDARLLCLRKVL